jgi:hypothetical protein
VEVGGRPPQQLVDQRGGVVGQQLDVVEHERDVERGAIGDDAEQPGQGRALPGAGPERGLDRGRQTLGALAPGPARQPALDSPRPGPVGPQGLAEGDGLTEPGAGHDRGDGPVPPGIEPAEHARAHDGVRDVRR